MMYTDNVLDFDAGLLEEDDIYMIPIDYTQNNDIGVSGLPIIGNETVLNDGIRRKVRDAILLTIQSHDFFKNHEH